MSGKIIEIIGCAGSGKSSVIKVLSKTESCIQTSIPPKEYKIQCVKCVIYRLPKLILLFLLRVRRHYLKTLVRVEAVLAVVQRGKKKHLSPDKTLVFDQGPISKLAYLYTKGVPNRITGLWLKTLQAKAIQIFDFVIWLDARNDVLQFRINHRNHPHKMKNKPKELADRFHDGYRACFKTVINNGANRIPCEYIDTEHMSIENVSEAIRKLL